MPIIKMNVQLNAYELLKKLQEYVELLVFLDIKVTEEILEKLVQYELKNKKDKYFTVNQT